MATIQENWYVTDSLLPIDYDHQYAPGALYAARLPNSTGRETTDSGMPPAQTSLAGTATLISRKRKLLPLPLNSNGTVMNP